MAVHSGGASPEQLRAIVREEIGGLEERLGVRMDKLEGRMGSVEQRLDKLTDTVEQLRLSLARKPDVGETVAIAQGLGDD